MKKFGKAVVKLRIPILILGIALMIPALIGYLNTRINYDMLTYLPEDIETIEGQNILLDEFGKGAFTIVIVDDMNPKDVAKLKANFQEVDHVESVIWYDSLADLSIPMEFLPSTLYDAFNSETGTIMAIFFDTSTSADETMDAISEIRSIAGKQCFVSGMSAMVTDLKELCEKEEPIYVAIAVALACIVMMLFMDSWLVPIIFLLSIGMAIIWNLGSNIFFGEISYITKALSAVLQLAVTMDYSIFLWHSYSEEKVHTGGDKKEAMAQAIANTITSVTGSSITTIAGFIALCFMTFTLGRDLGIVMAKGVFFGVIGCVTILPSMILILDRAIEKTKHRPLLPKFDKLASGIVKFRIIFLLLFVIILIPAFFGYKHTEQYYDLTESLPKNIDFAIANDKLKEEYGISTTHMILADADLDSKSARMMIDHIKKTDGVSTVLGMDSLIGSSIPSEFIPDSVKEVLKSENYQLILVLSEYKTASDEVNAQIDTLNDIIKQYDDSAMLIGEAPCTKDLIDITDTDFKTVNLISIAAIFVIILLVLKSVSLPFLLVAVIEFAIFINLGIPYYTGTVLPFIAPICISTIQLGATVDYAILMTTRYKKERSEGCDKQSAVTTALASSMPSIITSALGFFAATFGVAIYSDLDLISSLCSLMARGAIISMFAVILVLPSLLMVFDFIITHTGLGFRNRKQKAEQITDLNN